MEKALRFVIPFLCFVVLSSAACTRGSKDSQDQHFATQNRITSAELVIKGQKIVDALGKNAAEAKGRLGPAASEQTADDPSFSPPFLGRVQRLKYPDIQLESVQMFKQEDGKIVAQGEPAWSSLTVSGDRIRSETGLRAGMTRVEVKHLLGKPLNSAADWDEYAGDADSVKLFYDASGKLSQILWVFYTG